MAEDSDGADTYDDDDTSPLSYREILTQLRDRSSGSASARAALATRAAAALAGASEADRGCATLDGAASAAIELLPSASRHFLRRAHRARGYTARRRRARIDAAGSRGGRSARNENARRKNLAVAAQVLCWVREARGCGPFEAAAVGRGATRVVLTPVRGAGEAGGVAWSADVYAGGRKRGAVARTVDDGDSRDDAGAGHAGDDEAAALAPRWRLIGVSHAAKYLGQAEVQVSVDGLALGPPVLVRAVTKIRGAFKDARGARTSSQSSGDIRVRTGPRRAAHRRRRGARRGRGPPRRSFGQIAAALGSSARDRGDAAAGERDRGATVAETSDRPRQLAATPRPETRIRGLGTDARIARRAGENDRLLRSFDRRDRARRATAARRDGPRGLQRRRRRRRSSRRRGAARGRARRARPPRGASS